METKKTKGCIVIVDDDSDAINYIETILKSEFPNCTVASFDSISRQFLEFVITNRVDLFIMDVCIGIDDGIALTSNLLIHNKSYTFLFISGYDYKDEDFGMFDGKCVYDYIPKPLHHSDLVLRVATLLNVSRSFRKVMNQIRDLEHDYAESAVDDLHRKYFETLKRDRDMIAKLRSTMLKK